MKRLSIDLELLVQSFSFNEDDLGKEYLDRHTGNIINIPSEVNSVITGNKKVEALEDWERLLLEDAYAIKEDKENRYITIPCVEESYIHNVMEDFARDMVLSEVIRKRLLDALSSSEPVRNFKNTIYEYRENLDMWHDYEDKKLKEYVVNWLLSMGINPN